MSDQFVPFAAAVKNNPDAFTSLHPKLFTQDSSAPDTAGQSPSANGKCVAKPTVTLQRNGDTVSGIRVQCGCGQVIDLACVY